MLKFQKTCPLCHNAGTAESNDGRNMFHCLSCGLNTPIINLKYYERLNEETQRNDACENV